MEKGYSDYIPFLLFYLLSLQKNRKYYEQESIMGYDASDECL